MNKKMVLIISILLVVSLTISACDISITINPTSMPPPANTPRLANTPRPTVTKVISSTDEPAHEMYAGFTGDSKVPFLILHQSGEKVGITQNINSSNKTGLIWVPTNGESIVIYTNVDGKPKSAVVGEDIILYSNYTNSTVDLSIVHPNGTRDLFRSKIDASLLNKTMSLSTPSYSPIAFSISNPLQAQQQNIWGYIDEGLFALEIATCVGVARAFVLNIPALAALAVACHSPLLELKIREGKAENIDVGTLETLQDGLDIYGCYAGKPMDCINKFVRDMAESEQVAANKVSNVPPAPAAGAPAKKEKEKENYP